MLYIRYMHSRLALTLAHFECILVCMKHTLILAIALALTACSTVTPRQAHQPQLFEQIPNWDNEAQRVCKKLTNRC